MGVALQRMEYGGMVGQPWYTNIKVTWAQALDHGTSSHRVKLIIALT